MASGYPFQPLKDSLFGESFAKLWVSLGRSEEELTQHLHNIFILNNSSDPSSSSKEGISEFVYTKNTTKEILLSSIPIQLRKSMEEENWKELSQVLFRVGYGKYDHQTSPGLDVLFELLEWLLTGFADRKGLEIFLQDFFSFIGKEDLPPGWEDPQKIGEQLFSFYQENFS